ncbi:hypothetical protein H9L39_17907 [Fusarium oxysporum f. sp. albedinis]|nr:hypothetical protein H9L39_17907 [Fusarium oxysporum f. sp. albedinis]
MAIPIDLASTTMIIIAIMDILTPTPTMRRVTPATKSAALSPTKSARAADRLPKAVVRRVNSAKIFNYECNGQQYSEDLSSTNAYRYSTRSLGCERLTSIQ